MPVDLEKIKNLASEESEMRLHPRTYKDKKKQLQNMTHWVVVMYGKTVNAIQKNKKDCELFLEDNPQLYEDQPTIQKLICYETIQCRCGLTSTLTGYKFKYIYYLCSNKHVTKISEYA